MRIASTLLAAILLSSCSNGHYQDYLNLYNIPQPSPDSFTHCYDYGCKTKVQVTLPQHTKSKLQKLFQRSSLTPSEEREKISAAIGIFEQDIGNLTGTKNDKYGTFRLYQDDAETTKTFQQDCIDETTNTTIYVALLEQLNLIRYHRITFPETRSPLAGGGLWWHRSAVLEEVESGPKFAIDSWFKDNGHPAVIIPLSEWENGWSPSKQ